MKAVLASYHPEGWGDFFVIAVFIGAAYFVQLKDMGYLDLIRDSFRVIRCHERIRRRACKELRRKMRFEYIQEKRKLCKRQNRRIRQRLYMMWSPYMEQKESAAIVEFRKESA